MRPLIVAAIGLPVIGCATQTEQDLTNALREYVGDTSTTSESVRSAPPPPPTVPRVAASPATSTTTTTAPPRVGDGRTITRQTADQADRCLSGWQTMSAAAHSLGRIDRDDFERSVHECDRAIELLTRDRTDETDSVGPTAQLSLVLLLLRLQWLGAGLQFEAVCPPDSLTPCALSADDIGGSFGFLVLSGPTAIVPAAFIGELDGPLDVSQIPGLRVE